MSRAKAVAKRIRFDRYITPDPLALRICEELRRLGEDPAIVIEPSAGTGAFVRAARKVWPRARIIAVELKVGPRRRRLLRASGADEVIAGDWVEVARGLAVRLDEYGPRRLIAGNPPFSRAEAHTEAGLDVLRAGERLTFLLRLNFLGATSRVPFWRRGRLLELATIVPRPSFRRRRGGTDGTEYAAFSWRNGYRGLARTRRPLVWAPRRARAA